MTVAADADHRLKVQGALAPALAAAIMLAGLSALSPRAQAQDAETQRIDIYEYRVEGVHILAQTDVERAVYPFLGPKRTIDEVERARSALEKAYTDRGFQTVAVEIPEQQVREGIVVLKVTEGAVGRLRVRGSRYFSLDQIKAEAPSLAEGTVPNFNDVTRDIVGLNQLPDRRVTPSLRAGVEPGTVDVDLNVEDRFPLHGSLELNNQYSADTKPLRLNASLRYDNLWQLGHSVSLTYQVGPQNTDEAESYIANYTARFPNTPWLSLSVTGIKNNSDVSTLGNMNVIGKGESVMLRAMATLPSDDETFFHQLSGGIDYKHNTERSVTRGDATFVDDVPLTYYPVSTDYYASWAEEKVETNVGVGLTFNLRGPGSGQREFDEKRFNASANFFHARANFSRTQPVWGEALLFGRLYAQWSNRPLVSGEQITAGGSSTVRGYIESEAMADRGIIGSIELRSPSLTSIGGGDWSDGEINEWRVYTFIDAASLAYLDPLPEQEDHYDLAGVGVGSSIRLLDYLNGSLDLGVPLIDQDESKAGDPRVHFRVWGEF